VRWTLLDSTSSRRSSGRPLRAQAANMSPHSSSCDGTPRRRGTFVRVACLGVELPEVIAMQRSAARLQPGQKMPVERERLIELCEEVVATSHVLLEPGEQLTQDRCYREKTHGELQVTSPAC